MEARRNSLYKTKNMNAEPEKKKRGSTGLVSMKFIRLLQVRLIGTFLPKDYGMEFWFVRQMQREGHLEYNGAGYYSMTEKTQKEIEALRIAWIKMDKAAGKTWKELYET
mgnify:CR=1 FL=1